MKTLEEIRAFFRDDRFAMEQGIVIDSVDGDEAVCSVQLFDRHSNAMGSVQGGLIYTLADFAFAVAANSQQCATVTLSSTINYLRPPKGKRLTAATCCVHRSKSTCLYHIAVTDELGTLVAQVAITGYIKNIPARAGL